MGEYNFDAKTFFIVLHDKALENMGLKINWKDLDKVQRDLEQAYRELDINHYTTICKSEKDKMHIHSVVTFNKTHRFKAVSKLLGNCHVEPQRGTKEEALDYIEKKGKWEEKGEEVLRGFGDKSKITANPGARTDLERFDIIAMQEDFDLNEYILTNCTDDKTARMLENRYKRLLKRNAKAWREVKVIYVEGKAGSGKTRVAMETYPRAFRADVSEHTTFPFNGYNGEKVLILDELRPGVFSHAELMQILDGYKLNLNIKYGQINAMWETVIITTAMPLMEWYKDKTDKKGQDNRRDQFMRRISEHKIAVNGVWHDYIESEQGWENIVQLEIPFENIN